MKAMKTAVAILALALAGCTGLDTLQSTVANGGAAAADEVKDTAEFALCRGITVGSWLRAYGNSADRAQAWRVLCSQAVSETPAKK